MIQRIQSIFLFLAALCFFGLFAFPFASSDVVGQSFFADQTYNIHDHEVLLGLTILGGLLALIAIFLFKKRTLQMRLSIFVIIASLFIILVASLLIYNNADSLGDIEITENLGIGLPVLAIIFAVLANRFIRKDEKLVRSMDRLR